MIKEGLVYYRFSSEKKGDSITFQGGTIALGDLK